MIMSRAEAVLERTSGPRVVPVDAFTAPAWVRRLIGGGATTAIVREGLRVEVTDAERLTFVQVVLPGALDLDTRSFERRVVQVYAVLREQLAGRRAGFPLRFWNYIPGIHGPAHDGMDRYQVFNAGRFSAFSDWYRTASFGPRMIAASGVGHRTADFVVQALAGERPGRGLENPRQRAAYCYSKRYGPRPPCFARATVVDDPTSDLPGGRLMIVAGTASVVAEDSVHQGDLERQLAETCANLESLIAAANPGGGDRQPLSRFRELRTYVVDEASQAPLIGRIAARFPDLERLELMSADLCRADLLVEVEGVVGLDPLPPACTRPPFNATT
jgi:chorismate lyase/3-hydroxybenzoate synthase